MTLKEIIGRDALLVSPQVVGPDRIGFSKPDIAVDSKAIYSELAGIDRRGGFQSNNGVVVCVDQNNNVLVGWASSETISALAQAGYTHKGMWVPYSNGGQELLERVLPRPDRE